MKDAVDIRMGEDGSILIALKPGHFKADEKLTLLLDRKEERLILEQDGVDSIGLSTANTNLIELITEAPELFITEEVEQDEYQLFSNVAIEDLELRETEH